ncbi:TIGR03618 family F420-dependent PPOX class oxidoreductase [Pseudonocardia xinjiangensis]|uniref:TIGR03618 family F420-dependent PPOX class oxidoreductase n=1 Tax=Pseudonocardia xinjiangensis TaxID=75289 RepID=UPI003D8DB878
MSAESTPGLPPEIVEMLGNPNPAVIGTVRRNGAPVTVATWYLYRHERIVVNMDAGRRRLDHIRQDPRVSLTVLDRDDWGTHVSMQGRLTLLDDHDLRDIDEIARHYTGQAYPQRDRPRVTGVLDIETWHGWGRFA